MSHSVLDMFSVKSNPAPTQRAASVPDHNIEPDSVPNAELKTKGATIAPDDWDDLFHAIESRLETCVDQTLNNSLALPLPKRHAVTKAAVLECVASMRQLHASLTLERKLHHSSSPLSANTPVKTASGF